MSLSKEEKLERSRIAARKWRQENPEKALQSCRNWRMNNLEHERTRGSQRYSKNPELELARSKKWFADHPERTKELRQKAYHLYKNKDVPSNRREAKLYSAAKKRATAKNWDFTIEVEDVIIPEFCPVLGIPLISKPVETGGRGNATDNSPSLDRIDSAKGYIKGNIAVISWKANAIKHNGTAEEHRLIADYIDRMM